jgi:hypothetical protein
MNSPRRFLNAISQHGRRVPAVAAAVAAVALGVVGFAPAAGATGGTSNGVAGYSVEPSGGLASASVTFTVPTISCTRSDDTTGAYQEDGVYTLDLSIYALVQTLCSSTGPTDQYVFATSAGAFTEPGAAAGDIVVASLFQSGSATWAEIHDLTNGDYWVANNPANQAETTAWIGTLNPYYLGLHIPTYTKIHFSNATVNGDDIGFASVGATSYETVDSANVVIAKPSALTTTGTGTTFSVKFKHAS